MLLFSSHKIMQISAWITRCTQMMARPEGREECTLPLCQYYVPHRQHAWAGATCSGSPSALSPNICSTMLHASSVVPKAWADLKRRIIQAVLPTYSSNIVALRRNGRSNSRKFEIAIPISSETCTAAGQVSRCIIGSGRILNVSHNGIILCHMTDH